MDTQELRHRAESDQQVVADDYTNPPGTTTTTTSDDIRRDSKTSKMALAKRGLKSLTLALAIPMSLNLLSIALLGSGQNYKSLSLTKWVPPLWPIHMVNLLTSLFMTLSAWLFWTDGGFHKQPRACYMYAAGMMMNLLWDPVVLGFGASRVGLGVCVGLISALIGCYKQFNGLNQAAGHLVKPCFGLAGVLALVNLRLASI